MSKPRSITGPCFHCGQLHDPSSHDHKPNPDRHKDGSRVIAVRLDAATYAKLQELVANSVVNHDTLGGYVRWLIATQALRRR